MKANFFARILPLSIKTRNILRNDDLPPLRMDEPYTCTLGGRGWMVVRTENPKKSELRNATNINESHHPQIKIESAYFFGIALHSPCIFLDMHYVCASNGVYLINIAMKIEIQRPETYSRGNLILRLLFGWLYIGLPHGIHLILPLIWTFMLHIAGVWILLFKGAYPQSFFEYQERVLRYSVCVLASLFNLTRAYPAFSFKDISPELTFELGPLEETSRLRVFLRLLMAVAVLLFISVIFRSGYIWDPDTNDLLGFLLLFPASTHVIVPHYLFYKLMSIAVVLFFILSFFAILFSSRYPRTLYHYVLECWRYNYSLASYVLFFTHKYPRFPIRLLKDILTWKPAPVKNSPSIRAES